MSLFLHYFSLPYLLVGIELTLQVTALGLIGGLILGLILAWMRALGEFGATIVMAYHPYTLPVYVYVQLSGLGVDSALPLALLSLGVSVLVVGLVLLIERHGKQPLHTLLSRPGLPARKP